MNNEPLVLLVGFGSIGRRHLRNLRALGVPDQRIIVARTGRSTLPDDELTGVTVVSDLAAALAHQPRATIIANPTSLHLATALAAAQAGSSVFMEKPIAYSLDGVDQLRSLVEQKALTFFVGFQFRFHPGLRQVKQWLDGAQIGKIIHVQVHWGEYLPDWHPWEDYRQSYSARADLGGGVVLTLSHPLDYVRWLVGDVTRVFASLGYQGLDIEAEDTADIHLEFAQGAIGHVHLDYVQRPSSHTLRITGTEGSIRWDNADGIAHCYRAAAQTWESVAPAPDFERNRLFLDELQHFLACIAGEAAPLCTFDDGVRALEIALAAKQSAALGQALTL
ncbi:MAG: Gfo/Idh/MocA family oxidoreductase [Chloroflexota bacterium]